MTTIGLREARADFSSILKRVAGGEVITVSRHGVAMAHLMPPSGGVRGSQLQLTTSQRESMTTMGLREARADFSSILRRVAGGEAITVSRHSVAMAHLLPPKAKVPKAKVGSAKVRARGARAKVAVTRARPGGAKAQAAVSRTRAGGAKAVWRMSVRARRLTIEEEKQLVVLFAVSQLGDVAPRGLVLDLIETNGWLRLDRSDREPMASRNEARWRNGLALTHSHLVLGRCLSGTGAITTKGRDLLRQHAATVQTELPRKLSRAFLSKVDATEGPLYPS